MSRTDMLPSGQLPVPCARTTMDAEVAGLDRAKSVLESRP